MTEIRNIRLKLVIKGNQLDVEELRSVIEKSDLNVKFLSSTPLHMGTEEVTILLSLVGTGASLMSLFNKFWEKQSKYEIQMKTEDDETITLQKNSPWTLKDIKKFINLEKD